MEPFMKNAVALSMMVLFATIATADKPTTGPANRLAKESSPYLRQHARNPVDWFPWGPEAFEKAKKEGKLVFLSIGYSSCHWCHVMERESFSNAEVAKILNDGFVCIKVDREERPDIDDIYMNAVNVMGQNGGWPLSMFLLPDGKPFVGGTYWPPDDRVIEGETVKGFKSILKIVKKIQKEHAKEIAEQADKIAEITRERLAQRIRGVAIVELNQTLVSAATGELVEQFDEVHGGFGNKAKNFRGTKFPMPSYLELLHVMAARTELPGLKSKLNITLEKMAEGGIYDQIGGGFHRYSTERTWTVPHFEKMLYDNAQLVEVYAKAHAAQPNPLYERTIRDTLDFVLREMASPEGGFYSALDADSEGEEGRFYVWTPKDLETALTNKDELSLARAVYGVENGLNFENKYSIPTRNEALAEIAAKRKMSVEQLESKMTAIRHKLFIVRAKRERPFLDTKVLTAWNGQMIAAFALAGKVLKEPKYTDAAKKAAEFVLKMMRNKDGRLFRTYLAETGTPKLNGYLDDYAFFIHGLLGLHDATGEARWLNEAKTLTDLMVKWHWDKDGGGFFYTSHDHEKLFARSKDQYDGAQPSGNSVAARDLVRLYARTKDEQYRDLAQKQFAAFAAVLKSSPTSLTTMIVALHEFLPLQPAAPADFSKAPLWGNLIRQRGGAAVKSDSVVKVTATADKPAADGTQVVTIMMEIDKPWHSYANPIDNEMLDAAKTVVKVSGKGDPNVEKIDYPKGVKVEDKTVGDYMVYEGKVTIKAMMKRASGDKEPLLVTVKFMACESGQNGKPGRCLLPATVTVKVP
jgi:uncharacterized protein YyaL (SSP411 family)